MKTLLATAALAIAGVATVQAADIAPVTGHWTRLGEHSSALVYYIDEPDGFHVVVTTQQGARDKAAVERFTKEFAPLVTSGPPGITGYTTGRPAVREVFAYWPALISKAAVTPRVRLLER